MSHDDDNVSNPRAETGVATISDLVAKRISRRDFLGGATALSGLAVAGCATPAGPTTAGQSASAAAFSFEEIARGMDETHHVPDGYLADVLLRWGDPLFPDAPAFDPENQSVEAQHKLFGQNNDFVGFIAMEPEEDGAERALLCVNHEFTTARLMFPGVAENYPDSMTAQHCEIEMAAHGSSIVEIKLQNGKWAPVVGSKYARRVTAATTPMTITGPAAGHDRLKTAADPKGLTAAGTMNNCAGGITAWGTYLMAEENFHGYFSGDLPADHPEADNYARYGVGASTWYAWGRHFDRYNLEREPNEPNRFGWIVEVDPFDPASTPKKRTAIGRFKHEGAESVIAPDGRVVLYTGDDERFEYVYKFVSARRYDPDNRAANMDILEDGTLYVARFDEDGTVEWLPLTFGAGPLTPENRFYSQADVMIETRRAADLLGATPMDRPEDVEPDPRTGRVWVMLTNNHRRTEEQVNAANPRPNNEFGHIVEIIEPDGDFAATRSRWEFLVKCGDPNDPDVGAMWNAQTSANGWFGSPDNCAIDPSGRLWVATDGNENTGANDGLWAMETIGEMRGTGRAFFRAPIGAEVCGPRFADDGRTLFVAVQHPGDGRGTTYEKPSTRWPDFKPDMTARSAVVAIRRKDGGVIGG